MNKKQKNLVKECILKSRQLLEQDISERLIYYGIYKDPSRWLEEDKLNHLSLEEKQIRENIIIAIKKLEKTVGIKESINLYIKEVSYTYMNRIAGLRYLEIRNIIPNVLESQINYDNKSQFYRDMTEIAGELCSNSDKGWPFIFKIVFEEISSEIKVLFDPSDEYSVVFPSNITLTEIFYLLIEVITRDIWVEDEIIGWIYQYFNTKEKDEVFENLYKKKIKINSETLPAATQLFTPDWIVKYLVDNTLGTYWLEMKSDSKIKDYCTYIIKTDIQSYNNLKKVSEIRLLDPACGSGHFLLYAFDVFYKMYEEEGLVNSEDIPSSILANNLYGIDIDLRAIQLTALALFAKAKTYNKNLKNIKMNIVAADAVLQDETNKEKLINNLKDKIPSANRLVDVIWNSLLNIRELGSLIRIDNEIKKIIEIEKIKLGVDQLPISYFSSDFNNNPKLDVDEYWKDIEKSILYEVSKISKESFRAIDISEFMFAANTEKTIHIVDYLINKYDIVVTNPPYMGKKSMNEKIRSYLDNNYSDYDYDLYSAFIERCIEFTKSNGLIGMITQDTFMFIFNYTKLRIDLLKRININSVIHLGPKAFEEITGEKVRTVGFVFQKNITDNNNPIFLKLTDVQNKKFEFEKTLSSSNKERVFRLEKKEILKIKGVPFIYWISNELRDIFKYSPFSTVAQFKKGMTSGDNNKFIRYTWEIRNRNEKWYPYCMSDKSNPYFGLLIWLINYENNGFEIKNFKDEKGKLRSRPQNTQWYFKEAITFSKVAGEEFSARYLPQGYIFDDSSNCIFPTDMSINYILGFINSDLVRYILLILNPTFNFNMNDLERIPFKIPSKDIQTEIEECVSEIILLKKKTLENIEISQEFKSPLLLFTKNTYKQHLISFLNQSIELAKKYIDLRDKINAEVYGLYLLKETDIFLIKNHFSMKKTIGSSINIDNSSFLEILYTLDKYNISPEKLKQLLLDQETNLNRILKFEIENLISYFLGILFGRWKLFNNTINENSILSFDEKRDDYAIKRLREILELIYGVESVDKKEIEIKETLGKTLESYLLNDFFKFHSKEYKKRPIYWHIQSPNKYFNCFIYYHKLDNDTLHKLKSHYIRERLEIIETQIKSLRSNFNFEDNSHDKLKYEKKLDELLSEKEDLEETSRLIQEIIDEGYSPNIDEGVKVNITPFVNKGLMKVGL